MIEQIITEYLRSSAALAQVLAQYGGAPAVFCQKVPDDGDPGWEQGRQFPRAVHLLDLTGDPQREREGTLSVDLFCLSPNAPEDLEPLVREWVDGRFFLSGERVLSAAWRASSYFTEPAGKVDGVTVSFDLVEYPMQALDEPDPVRLLNSYVREQYPQAAVIGLSGWEEAVVTPSRERPVFYCQLTGLAPCGQIPDTFHCVWRTASLQLHIAAGDRREELAIASRLAVDLARRRRLFFPDKGPMMVEPPKVQPSTAPQRTPYLTVEGSFGILRQKPPASPLLHAVVGDGIGKEDRHV